jgi:hypothetical protein
VWDAVALKALYIVYSTFDIGDVFSVVYSQSLQTIYLGAQNTSIQVVPDLFISNCSGTISKVNLSGLAHPRPPSQCADLISSLILRNQAQAPQIKAMQMTMGMLNVSRYSRLNHGIKFNSHISDMSTVYI